MEFTLNFTNKAQYKKAIQALWNSAKYRLIVYGRCYGDSAYGYVTFTTI